MQPNPVPPVKRAQRSSILPDNKQDAQTQSEEKSPYVPIAEYSKDAVVISIRERRSASGEAEQEQDWEDSGLARLLEQVRKSNERISRSAGRLGMREGEEEKV